MAGSATGLALVSVLSGPLGLGRSIAVLAGLPLIALVAVAVGFPETARRDLDETSSEGR